jgi:aspartate oxidase
MKNLRSTDALIIGAGFSGLYLGFILLSYGYKNFLIAAPDKPTISDKSYFNFRSRGIRQESLKDSMIKAGKGGCNRQLVNTMVNNIDDELTNLSDITELKASYLGASAVNSLSLMKRLKKETEKHRIYDEIKNIKKIKTGILAETEEKTIRAQKLIFASGGNRSRFSENFNDERISFDAFKLAQKINCCIESPDKIMYHPFYSKGKCISSDSLFGFDIINEKRERMEKTYALIRAHNAHHRFDEIIKEFKGQKCYAVRGKTRILLNTEPHYTLGGIKINKHGKTNIKNVYALGECSFGMHGLGRIGGCALSEILVMSRIIAKQII